MTSDKNGQHSGGLGAPLSPLTNGAQTLPPAIVGPHHSDWHPIPGAAMKLATLSEIFFKQAFPPRKYRISANFSANFDISSDFGISGYFRVQGRDYGWPMTTLVICSLTTNYNKRVKDSILKYMFFLASMHNQIGYSYIGLEPYITKSQKALIEQFPFKGDSDAGCWIVSVEELQECIRAKTTGCRWKNRINQLIAQ